jgi:hypothetical protein
VGRLLLAALLSFQNRQWVANYAGTCLLRENKIWLDCQLARAFKKTHIGREKSRFL